MDLSEEQFLKASAAMSVIVLGSETEYMAAGSAKTLSSPYPIETTGIPLTLDGMEMLPVRSTCATPSPVPVGVLTS